MINNYPIFTWIHKHLKQIMGGVIILMIIICAGFLITACFAKESLYWIIQAGKTAIIASILIITIIIVTNILNEMKES